MECLEFQEFKGVVITKKFSKPDQMKWEFIIFLQDLGHG